MANLHQNYKEKKVVMTNGEFFYTRSTINGNEIVLAIDKHTHPAWNKEKGIHANFNSSPVKSFNSKFDIDFTS